MSRRNLLCLSAGVAALSGLNSYAQSQQQPNIVIIVADDLGYGDLSCYGATSIRTPGMDRIANEGLRFTQGYCTAATSTPSRYSLLTGLYPWTPEELKRIETTREEVLIEWLKKDKAGQKF